MRAAAEQGVEYFITTAHASGWVAPVMPSQWHIERVSPVATRPARQAARDLGGTLGRRLAELAAKLQTLPPAEELRRTTAALCDLAEWCAATEGYGNALLTQRCLDLAAVGVARLAADEKFPLDKISPLAARLRPPFAGPAVRQRILNAEAGAELFAVAEQADLERTWAAGARADAPAALRAHQDFFHDERPGRGEPMGLAATWGRKWHERLVDGLDLRTAMLAVSLVEFRRAVGKFPAPVMAARGAEPAAARGVPGGLQLVASVRVVPAGQRAFQEAWAGYLQTAAAGRGAAAGPRVADAAWMAFDAVAQGEFLDQDTRSEKFVPAAPAGR